MNGVFLLDKPRGPTSFDVVAESRRRLHEKRVGHTGTLNPMATGLLIVCAGEACKLVPFLTECDKTYEAEVVFGVRTATGDAEGEVVEQLDASGLRPDDVALAAAAMVGPSEQRPPMYSAVRVDGKRLHTLARQGLDVERASRPIVLHQLAMTHLEGPKYRLEVTCSKGTYVRVIAEDLGAALGVGAHLSALRRTAIGRHRVADAIQLADLSTASPRLELAPALSHLPSRTLDPTGAKRVRDGQERWLLGLPDPPPLGRSVILNEQGGLVAVLIRRPEKIEIERVFVDNPPSPKAHTPDTKNDQKTQKKEAT